MTSQLDRVDVLAATVSDTYWRLVLTDPSPPSTGACFDDPAVAWAAAMAVRGHPLPTNSATEQALTVAARRMRSLLELAEACR